MNGSVKRCTYQKCRPPRTYKSKYHVTHNNLRTAVMPTNCDKPAPVDPWGEIPQFSPLAVGICSAALWARQEAICRGEYTVITIRYTTQNSCLFFWKQYN